MGSLRIAFQNAEALLAFKSGSTRDLAKTLKVASLRGLVSAMQQALAAALTSPSTETGGWHVMTSIASDGSSVIPSDDDLKNFFESLPNTKYCFIAFDSRSSECQRAAGSLMFEGYVDKLIDHLLSPLYFGSSPSGLIVPNLNFLPVWIYCTQGPLGAAHKGCGSSGIFIGTSSPTPTNISAYFELALAELVEVFEDKTNAWNCGLSDGEGLSRALAEEYASGFPLGPGFLVANMWLNGGRPDFVTAQSPSDTNFLANGCAVLFLNWLHNGKGYPWNSIIDAYRQPSPSVRRLSWLYEQLGGGNLATHALADFTAAVNLVAPPGVAASFPTNNPWLKVSVPPPPPGSGH